jgi:hypothetical protein
MPSQLWVMDLQQIRSKVHKTFIYIIVPTIRTQWLRWAKVVTTNNKKLSMSPSLAPRQPVEADLHFHVLIQARRKLMLRKWWLKISHSIRQQLYLSNKIHKALQLSRRSRSTISTILYSKRCKLLMAFRSSKIPKQLIKMLFSLGFQTQRNILM